MRAWQVTREADGTVLIAPLPLPSLHRDGGWIDPAPYRRQASGELPMPQQNLAHSRGLRTIRLADGPQPDLFTGSGDTLNFVIAGQLAVQAKGGSRRLDPGDLLLVRGAAAQELAVNASGGLHLVQLGVESDWPGAEAVLQDEGTVTPRRVEVPNLRRMDKQEDDRTWFSSFANFFPAGLGEWSATTQVRGFRLLRFPDQAFIDWHPEVVNNLAIFLSGDMEIEVGGGANDCGPLPIDHFLAGDVLLAADRTGEGHIDRMHGVIHLALIVLDDEHLWPRVD